MEIDTVKDQATKEKFIELRAQGHSYEKIAGELQTSKQTLIAWARELSLELKNTRALQFDALRERYALTKQAQIELLGGRLQAIKKEVEKRDLKDIPTDKLLLLLLKYSQATKDEASPPSFTQDGFPSTEFDTSTLFKTGTTRTWEG